MANNPLDELVQTSSNPVTNPSVLSDVGSSASSPQASTTPNAVANASEIPSVASPVAPLGNPLDQLIAGAANTNTVAKSTPSSANPVAPLSSQSTTSQVETALPPSTPLGTSPVSTMQTPVNPSLIPNTNPLDSLINHDSPKKPIEANLASDHLPDKEQGREGALREPFVVSAQPLNPSPSLSAPGVMENPISLDTISKPTSSPNLPEHDIAPMPHQMSPLNKSTSPNTAVNAATSSSIKPATVATINADQGSTLSKKELEEKAKKLLNDSPPTSKNNKKPWILGLLTLLIVVGAAGGGLMSYKYLTQSSTDNRSKAGFVGQNACVSPKGIAIPPGQSSANQSGLFNYRPASADVNDATSYYDVSKNEGVSFSVQVHNTTASPLSDQYHFFAQKVIESPQGTPVDEDSPLDEATLEINHRNNGDSQETIFNSGNMNFSLGPNETKTLTGLWTPNNNECGLYQIDMGVQDFNNASCAQDLVVGAGFVRVVGCETACNATCSSNQQCTSMDSAYTCSRSQDASEWTEITANYASVGSGGMTCYNTSNNASKDQHLVRSGRIWSRSYSNNAWTAWADVTSNVNSAGAGTITSFSSFIGQDGHTQQHLVREGKIWYRKVEGNAWQTPWEDVTSNVNEVGAGIITGFNIYLKDGLYENQFLVKGGKAYRRDNRDGWSDWEEITAQLSQIGQGDITCLSGISESTNETQYFTRGARLYAYANDWFEGVCRLASNPASQTCAPAPTPELLACTSLTKAPLAPKLGDIVTFTCAAAPTPVAKYEFRYSIANGNYSSLNPEPANPNTAKLTVTSSGAYKIECRACEDAAATRCTTWGIAR